MRLDDPTNRKALFMALDAYGGAVVTLFPWALSVALLALLFSRW